MNSNKYFQFEEQDTLRRLRKMSGSQTLKIGFQIADMSLKMLASSIRDSHPRIGPAKLRQEVRKRLWHEKP